jgi:leucyl aminopeptidase
VISVRPATGSRPVAVLALPVAERLLDPGDLPTGLVEECHALLEQTGHTGRAGQVQALTRPLNRIRKVLLVGVGAGDESGWRAAGAAVSRTAVREASAAVRIPPDVPPAAVRGLVEGLLLASYRYRLGGDKEEKAPRLRRVTLAVDDPDRYAGAIERAQVVARATGLARDLTNTPSLRKNPAWFARQITNRASGAQVRVWDADELAGAGFGGILAVGNGSASPPRLVELSWRPRSPRAHVALVGKGITFDSGGISLKPADSMTLMRKDMAGAAAVVAATLAAAELRLPVRVTALAPLAENMPSGSAMRPGDVIRHYGGRTTEVRNTDAEGRLVLADALAYAAARLRPDALVDVATLTGANAIALGRRTAALYSPDDQLAGALTAAAEQAGEQVWRMPLVEDYAERLGSDLADASNLPSDTGGGSITAALFLREFTGAAVGRWAHFDMSAPSWIDRDDTELSRGATGWGVRTLLRWLEQY